MSTITDIRPDPAGSSQPLDRERLAKAAHHFEALFINQMLQVMKRSAMALTGDGEGVVTGGWNNPYQELFDWQLAVRLSEKSPLGLAAVLMKHYDQQTGSEPAANTSLPLVLNRPAVRPERLAPPHLDALVERAAIRHDLDPALVRAVIAVESGGDPKAVSPKGAKGLMQLMDTTARELGVSDSLNPGQNIEGGAAYLKRMLDRYDGDPRLALAAYNAGPGAVDRHGGVPPYRETEDYIQKVLTAWRQTRTTPSATPSSSTRSVTE